jgi:hypothetical protein
MSPGERRDAIGAVPRSRTRTPVEWLIGPLAAGAGIVLSVNRPGETARSAPKR